MHTSRKKKRKQTREVLHECSASHRIKEVIEDTCIDKQKNNVIYIQCQAFDAFSWLNSFNLFVMMKNNDHEVIHINIRSTLVVFINHFITFVQI